MKNSIVCPMLHNVPENVTEQTGQNDSIMEGRKLKNDTS